MAQVVWNDKEKMTDALTSEKYLTETYNSYTSETATPEVKSCFQNILCEEHDISCLLYTSGAAQSTVATPYDEAMLLIESVKYQ